MEGIQTDRWALADNTWTKTRGSRVERFLITTILEKVSEDGKYIGYVERLPNEVIDEESECIDINCDAE